MRKFNKEKKVNFSSYRTSQPLSIRQSFYKVKEIINAEWKKNAVLSAAQKESETLILQNICQV